MNVVLGYENVKDIDQKYVVLELDTIKISQDHDPVTAYCVIEHLPLTEIVSLDQFRGLHENLLKNYRKRNWKYCEDAIEHLLGKWNGEVDSFYHELKTRIDGLRDQLLDDSWNGVIDRSR